MSGPAMTVLILGGYGTFGARVAQMLADDRRLSLIIAGRSLAKAQALCTALPPGAQRAAAAIDRDGDLSAAFAGHAPDLVVDASGPFQDYGERPYRVVEAALDAGAHYLDLADGVGFVEGIGRLDAEAKAQSRFVLSGVSSFPVLTAAVVRELAQGLDWIHTIVGGIAPSPFAGVGANVLRAISGYAGKPVRMRFNGRHRTAYALTESMRYTVSPPGRLPLRNTRFSLVDVPDLAALPPMWPQVRTVWMGAGPRPEILHRGLNALAWLVRIKLLPSLAPLAPLFGWATQALRWGEHRGGMFVRLTGYIRNRPVERSWHLLAEGDDGPLIPAMAAVAVVRRCLDGRVPAPGARPCLTDLELADYEPLFNGRAILTGKRQRGAVEDAQPLYQRMLGDAWAALPAAVRALHDLDRVKQMSGRAEVERGRGPLAGLVAALIGFPKAGGDVPVHVAFIDDDHAEYWRRDFAGRRFKSRQAEGQGRWQGLLVERFGPVQVGLALVLDEGRLRLVVRRWSLLGVALPLLLGPGGEAYEFEQDGRFRFHVEIGHPLTGMIVRYRGWLEEMPADG